MDNEQAMYWHTVDDESFSIYYDKYILPKLKQEKSNNIEIEEDLPF